MYNLIKREAGWEETGKDEVIPLNDFQVRQFHMSLEMKGNRRWRLELENHKYMREFKTLPPNEMP